MGRPTLCQALGQAGEGEVTQGLILFSFLAVWAWGNHSISLSIGLPSCKYTLK